MTSNPNQGWRIAPKPGGALRRTESGRFARTMEITHDGEHKSDVEYVYTGGEIESLYREMRALYAAGVPTEPSRLDQKAEMGAFY